MKTRWRDTRTLHQTRGINKKKQTNIHQILQVQQNRDSLGLFEEKRARRGAPSSGSSSKQATVLRPRSKRSREEPGSMMSQKAGERWGCSGSACHRSGLCSLVVLRCYFYQAWPIRARLLDYSWGNYGAQVIRCFHSCVKMEFRAGVNSSANFRLFFSNRRWLTKKQTNPKPIWFFPYD